MTSLNLINPAPAATSAGLTTATTAYTAGDSVGTIWSWTVSSTGLITGGCLHDKADVLGACALHLFDRSVTLPADNAAPTTAPSDADNLFLIGTLWFPPPEDLGANRMASVDSLAKYYRANASSLIYGMLITLAGNAVFGATTDVVIDLHVTQDV